MIPLSNIQAVKPWYKEQYTIIYDVDLAMNKILQASLCFREVRNNFHDPIMRLKIC